MTHLILTVVLAFPKQDCLSNLWAQFNRCEAQLMTNCVSPNIRPTIDYMPLFEAERNDECYDIYLSSASFEVVKVKYK